MYDLPELRPATDALWTAIASRLRSRGVAAPDTLSRAPSSPSLWTDPRLLLSQTCGYPLMTGLAGRVALIATPCYRAPGCDGPLYRSAVLVRADDPAATLADLRGRRCAVNEATSNSGMNVLRAAIAPLADGARFFGRIVTTGSHAASVSALADNQADVAAIDGVIWAHLQRLRPAPSGKLRVLAWSDATPGLPLVTARATPETTRRAIATALDEVATDPALAEIRATLLLTHFARTGIEAYAPILDLERQAARHGYASLR